MKRLALLLVLACGGCSVAPAPAWKADAHDALESFAAAYLAGDSRTAARYFNDVSRDIFLKGAGIEYLAGNLALLALYAVILVGVASLRLRKKVA